MQKNWIRVKKNLSKNWQFNCKKYNNNYKKEKELLVTIN